MTIPSVKAIAAKVLTVGFLAGAFVMATAPKAQAEQVLMTVGYPHYEYVRHDGYDRRRAAECRHPREFRHDRGWR